MASVLTLSSVVPSSTFTRFWMSSTETCVVGSASIEVIAKLGEFLSTT